MVVGKEKVTWMKLTTKPLDNVKNYNKVKKALYSLPQIKDQVFDEKSNNTVIIKVVCCSPEEVMNKLCKKGGGAITTIDDGIDQTNPLAQKPKLPEKPKDAEKPKQADNPKPAAPSSQTMIYTPYGSAPMVAYPATHNGPYSDWRHPNGPYSDWRHPNGYGERPIYDSYGGGPPPPPSYYQEGCSIM